MFPALTKRHFLRWVQIKSFATDNLYVAQMMIYFYDRVENIVGKGENAGN